MIIILFLVFLSLTFEEFVELLRHSSVSADRFTRIYIDLSKFKKEKSIDLEFKIKLKNERKLYDYSFQFAQVNITNFKDSEYWKNLKKVKADNIKEKGSYNRKYTAYANIIKEEGKNYILLIPSIPYIDYDPLANNVIIKNPGGLNLIIVILIILGICISGIIITIIVVCCCFKTKNLQNSYECNNQTPNTPESLLQNSSECENQTPGPLYEYGNQTPNTSGRSLY